MPYYNFCIKKNDIFLEVSAESDHEFVASQMDKWTQFFTGNAASKKKEKAEKASKKAEPKKVDVDLNLVNMLQEHPAEQTDKPIIELPEEAALQTETVIGKKTAKEEPVKEPEAKEVIKETKQEIVEEPAPIVEELSTDEVTDVSSEEKEEIPAEDAAKNEIENKFQKILNKKISAMPETDAFDAISEIRESQNPKVSNLKDLFKAKQPDSLMEYLLITAYYLQKYENLDCYSLKQINAKVMPFSQSPIDHAIIQKAVSLEYIEVVPDFTGMADVTEYKITARGEQYVCNDKQTTAEI